MWSIVQTGSVSNQGAPSSRSKHAMCSTQTGMIYLLGGRSANLPLKDFWRFDPVQSLWEEMRCRGNKPPCLQEHTMVGWRHFLYVFGGEIGFASTGETPLWILDTGVGTWRKHHIRGLSGQQPSGRRGHTSVVYNGAMHVYGGYQDLRGSSSELWSFDFVDGDFSCFNVERCDALCCKAFQWMRNEDFNLTLDVKGNDSLIIRLKNETNEFNCLLKDINLLQFREILSCSLFKSYKVKTNKKSRKSILYIIVASTLSVACFITVCSIIGILSRRSIKKQSEQLHKIEKPVKTNEFDDDVVESLPSPDNVISETDISKPQSTFFVDVNPTAENECQVVSNAIYESKDL